MTKVLTLALLFMQVTFFTMFAKEIDSLPTMPDSHSPPPPPPLHQPINPLSVGYKANTYLKPHLHPSSISVPIQPHSSTPTHSPTLDRPNYKYECNSSHHSCPVKPPLPSHHGPAPRHRTTNSLSSSYKVDEYHNNHKHHHNHHHSSTISPAPSSSPSTPPTNPPILDRPNYKYECNSSHHSCPVKPPLPSHHGLTPHHRATKSLSSSYKMDQDHNNHKHHHNHHHSSTTSPTPSPSPSTPSTIPLILDRPNYKYECNSSHHSCPVKPPLPSHRGTTPHHLVTNSLSHGYKGDLDHNNHIHHQHHSSSTSPTPAPSPSTPHTNNE